MKLAIIANPEKYAVKKPFKDMLKWSDRHQVKVYFTRKLKKLYDGSGHASSVIVESEEEAVEAADIIIAIGGDGTMLYTARLVQDLQKPILGVNSGRLGFMANTQQDHIEQALQCLTDDDYDLDKRFMLQATDESGHTYNALNEFLFSKRDSTSMITVEAEYDGMFINTYWSDGLIVASPTGSTAYNLSCDGPLVMPNSNVMAVTPINPHTLTTRPLVLPSNKQLKVTVPKQEHEVLFSHDGTICDITDLPFKVRIQRSDFSVDLVELPNQSYFDTLRQKLMWGLDYRERG